MVKLDVTYPGRRCRAARHDSSREAAATGPVRRTLGHDLKISVPFELGP
ncbi:MAG: hypothetical protein U1E76_00890 [Planctomycetota bacterium]